MRPRRRRARSEDPERIEFVLGRAGEARFAPKPPPLTARQWAQAVGLRIADRTKPLSLERGTLVVQAASSTWASELSMLRDPILDRLRAQGIEVREVRFRVQPIAPPPRPAERRKTRAVPPPAPLPPELAAAVANVQDAELASIIRDAASRNLAWQDNLTRVSAGQPAGRAPQVAETESDPPARRTSPAPASPRRRREGA